jgi:hypothetical protein
MDGFFYGLYMDSDLLLGMGLKPANPRIAELKGFRLDLYGSVKVVSDPSKSVWGMVLSLSDEDLHTMYSGPKTKAYRAFKVSVHASDGTELPVQCYNQEATPEAPFNREYLEKLISTVYKLGLPGEYVRDLERIGN